MLLEGVYRCFITSAMATAAGTPNTKRKNGISWATEYPAFVPPAHMLTPAPMNHSGMNTLAAVATPCAGVGAPSQPPMSRHNASRPKPAPITLIECAMEWVGSYHLAGSEDAYVAAT